MPRGHQKQEQSPEKEDILDFPEAPLSASSPLSRLSYFTKEDQFTRDAESIFVFLPYYSLWCFFPQLTIPPLPTRPTHLALYF